MKMRKAVTEEIFNEIIAQHFAYGASIKNIAAMTGSSEKSVRMLCATFELVRDCEFKKLDHKLLGDNSVSDKAIVWSANRVNVELPSVVTDAMQQRKDKREKKAVIEEAQTTMSDEEERVEKKAVYKNENDALYMIKILEALHRQNELLEQLMDVVMPKYAADIKDNLNVNADVICERLKNSEQSLDKIAYNTRKRGV